MTLRWIAHNCAAHPLLVIWPRLGEWLHDRTEPEIRVRPGEITSAQIADNSLRVYVGGVILGDLVWDVGGGRGRPPDCDDAVLFWPAPPKAPECRNVVHDERGRCDACARRHADQIRALR